MDIQEGDEVLIRGEQRWVGCYATVIELDEIEALVELVDRRQIAAIPLADLVLSSRPVDSHPSMTAPDE